MPGVIGTRLDVGLRGVCVGHGKPDEHSKYGRGPGFQGLDQAPLATPLADATLAQQRSDSHRARQRGESNACETYSYAPALRVSRSWAQQ